MRRAVLLALLALVLPTVALANSVDFSTGTFVSGTMSGSTSTSFDISITGSINTVELTTGSLTAASCPSGLSGSCFDFSGGSLTVMSGSTTLFSDTLKGGMVNMNGNSLAILSQLSPSSMVKEGTGTVSLTFASGAVTAGSIDVSFNTVPEPGTLGLLGTGLVGLAGVVRRKLRVIRP